MNAFVTWVRNVSKSMNGVVSLYLHVVSEGASTVHYFQLEAVYVE